MNNKTVNIDEIGVGFPDGTFLRRESFGGILFNKYNGKLIEVNEGGYSLLVKLDGLKTVREVILSHLEITGVQDEETYGKIESFIHFLRLQRVICHNGQSAIVKPSYVTTKRNKKLIAPEIVHLSITDRCNLDCTCCYKNSISGIEPDDMQVASIIDECIRTGVLQLSFGGGEPLLKKNTLIKVMPVAASQMRVSVTTNGILIDRSTAERLFEAGLDHIQVSVNGPRNIHNNVTGTDDYDKRISGIEIALECGLFTGINCIVTDELVPRLDDFLSSMEDMGVRHVNLIRAKRNTNNDEWYDRNVLRSYSLMSMHDIFSRLKRDHPGLSLTHDCSFVQIYNKHDPHRLAETGVFGCTAWKRICYVTPAMDVYGCSHMVGNSQPAGNLSSQSLDRIWYKASSRFNINSNCTGCRINDICIPCVGVPEKEVISCEKD